MENVKVGLKGGSELTEKMQELLKQLEELDKKGPGPNSSKAEFIAYHSKRKQIIGRLIAESPSAQQRDLWTQQLINTLVSLIQLGELEGIVGEEDGYSAESDAAILLQGLDIPSDIHEKRTWRARASASSSPPRASLRQRQRLACERVMPLRAAT